MSRNIIFLRFTAGIVMSIILPAAPSLGVPYSYDDEDSGYCSRPSGFCSYDTYNRARDQHQRNVQDVDSARPTSKPRR